MTTRLTLKQWVAESIRRSQERGYNPTKFIGMWHADHSPRTIEKLVTSGEIQSGFRRMVRIGLIEWSMEYAVTVFQRTFANPEIQAAARWRLEQAKKGESK